MTTLLYTHPVFHDHEVPPGHVERPGRYDAVEKALSADVFDDLVRHDAPRCKAHDIERAHPTRYREMIQENAPTQGLAQLDPDTFMGPSSLEAAERGVGGARAAVDAVYSGLGENAFVASRPPGHHAEPDRAMGFCLFNNVVIAARHARHHGARRIAVIDFDVHHGNGTQSAFWDDEDAFFASSHEWPQYPGTGRESDRGAFDNIVNAPLPSGTQSADFQRVWGERLLPALSDFAPDFLVISAGFDAHSADPVGGLCLAADDFHWLTAALKGIAKTSASGRIVSVLEGGYDLDALGESAAAHVKALME